MNDDTVIGRIKDAQIDLDYDGVPIPPDVRLSDLDEPYRQALVDSTWMPKSLQTMREKYDTHTKCITELEARLGKAILDCNRKGERIAELEGQLAKTGAALEAADLHQCGACGFPLGEEGLVWSDCLKCAPYRQAREAMK